MCSTDVLTSQTLIASETYTNRADAMSQEAFHIVVDERLIDNATYLNHIQTSMNHKLSLQHRNQSIGSKQKSYTKHLKN